MVGEAAAQLGLAGVPTAIAMRQIVTKIPEVNFDDHLRSIALTSLRGMERIREKLAEEYGEVTIIGRGEGRHPDLAGAVLPDFIAFSVKKKEPIIIEAKNASRQDLSDRFQASYYNGIADRFGVYLLEERLEHGTPKISPRLIRGKAETVLIYPRIGVHSVVKERFVPDERMVKLVWKAKELGFKGLVPETDCQSKCAHLRLKMTLPEGDVEPAAPLPLIFSERIVESGFNLDTNYQVTYARKLLPLDVRLALLLGRVSSNQVSKWKEWLLNSVGLDHEDADIALERDKYQDFLRSKPDAESVLESAKDGLKPWEQLLKKRMKTSASVILGKATSLYSLPQESADFVKDSWKRWRRGY